ncbi:hypothetical protein P4S72_20195 [Vibrio sp. PP-XX7]
MDKIATFFCCDLGHLNPSRISLNNEQETNPTSGWNSHMNNKIRAIFAAIMLLSAMLLSASANAFFGNNDDGIKLGYLVKQPEEPWFQTEWNFAEKAGKKYNFEVIKMAVPDGEKTLNAIGYLSRQRCKRFRDLYARSGS